MEIQEFRNQIIMTMKKEYIRPKTMVVVFDRELLNVTSMYDEKGGPAEAKRSYRKDFADELENDFESED